MQQHLTTSQLSQICSKPVEHTTSGEFPNQPSNFYQHPNRTIVAPEADEARRRNRHTAPITSHLRRYSIAVPRHTRRHHPPGPHPAPPNQESCIWPSLQTHCNGSILLHAPLVLFLCPLPSAAPEQAAMPVPQGLIQWAATREATGLPVCSEFIQKRLFCPVLLSPCVLWDRTNNCSRCSCFVLFSVM